MDVSRRYDVDAMMSDGKMFMDSKPKINCSKQYAVSSVVFCTLSTNMICAEAHGE